MRICFLQPKFMPEMIRKQSVHDYDIVSGTRYTMGGGVQVCGSLFMARLCIALTLNFP